MEAVIKAAQQLDEVDPQSGHNLVLVDISIFHGPESSRKELSIEYLGIYIEDKDVFLPTQQLLIAVHQELHHTVGIDVQAAKREREKIDELVASRIKVFGFEEWKNIPK